MNKAERAKAEEVIRKRYNAIRDTLTERARRLFVGSEALAAGYGGVAIAARATGMAPSAILRGKKECLSLYSSLSFKSVLAKT